MDGVNKTESDFGMVEILGVQAGDKKEILEL